MSHFLNVYLLDLIELEAVIGSGNEEFLGRLLAEAPDHDPECGFCEPCESSDCEGPDCEECEYCEDAQLPHALRTIFAGGPFNEVYAHAYVAALESICQELGTSAGEVNFWFGYDGLPDVILTLASSMDGRDPFPYTEDNGWGHIGKQGCADQLAEWETIAAGPDDHGGYADSIVEWFRQSTSDKKDLIGFWAG
ncbi:hypothetical protein ABZ319_11165 [Nocardia sp. NPDC005978]|uniref:DUF7691 family protein n=1 Tax=Nocardia sp. NPDC005978 TaxID=3156725 RepID=UPI0033B4F18D